MKQITILIAAVVLTFADIYSADNSTTTRLSDFDQYAFLNNDDDFSYTQNFVEISAPVNVDVSGNNENITESDEESEPFEPETEVNAESSSEEILDGSAGAMGLGIF